MKQLIAGFFLMITVTGLRAQDIMVSADGMGDPFGPDAYVIPSILMSAGNGYMIGRNIHALRHGNPRRENAGFGLVTGALQTGYAILYHEKNQRFYPVLFPADLAIGLGTMLTSTIRLVSRPTLKEPKTTFNIITLPVHTTGRTVPGIFVCRKF